MRLAPNRLRADGLYRFEPSPWEVGRHERTCTRSDSRGVDPRCEHDLGRDRAVRGSRGADARDLRRKRLRRVRSGLARLRRQLRGDRPHLPRRSGSRRPAASPRVEGKRAHRWRLVPRTIRVRRALRLPRARLDSRGFRDHGRRALHDEPRRRLRGARGDGPEPDADREAAHVGDLRDRLRDGSGARRPLHHAQPLDHPLRRRLPRADCGYSRARSLVLLALRRPGDRAGDQARVRGALRSHVARRPSRLARRAPGLRARTCPFEPLPAAPPGAGAPARRRVRLPDAVLLLQGRDERVACSGCSS